MYNISWIFYERWNSTIPSCTASTNDRITVAIDVSFASTEIGKGLTYDLKIFTPTGYKTYNVGYTPTSNFATISTSNWATPIPLGAYATVMFTVYDESNAIICSSAGSGSGKCEILQINLCSQPSTNFNII